MTEPIVINPMTQTRDLRQVLSNEHASKFVERGVWMCFNKDCGFKELVEGEREIIYGVNGFYFQTKKCQKCGLSMNLIQGRLEVLSYSRKHLSQFHEILNGIMSNRIVFNKIIESEKDA